MQARIVFLVAYPESCPDIKTAILRSGADKYAYILHDKDTKYNPELDTTTPEKPHYHVYLSFTNEKNFKVLSSVFGTAVNNIEKAKSTRQVIRYLRHMDDSDKFQYPREDVISSPDFNVDKFFNSGEEDGKAAEVMEIVQMTASNGGNFASVIAQCCERGLYSYLRRGCTMFLQVYREYAYYYSSSKEEKE